MTPRQPKLWPSEPVSDPVAFDRRKVRAPELGPVSLDEMRKALMNHVRIDGQCWVWIGNRAYNTPRLFVRGWQYAARQVVWMITRGGVPPRQIECTCSNRLCVGPECITAYSVSRARSACNRGHDKATNWREYNGKGHCLGCMRERARGYSKGAINPASLDMPAVQRLWHAVEDGVDWQDIEARFLIGKQAAKELLLAHGYDSPRLQYTAGEAKKKPSVRQRKDA